MELAFEDPASVEVLYSIVSSKSFKSQVLESFEMSLPGETPETADAVVAWLCSW